MRAGGTTRGPSACGGSGGRSLHSFRDDLEVPALFRAKGARFPQRGPDEVTPPLPLIRRSICLECGPGALVDWSGAVLRLFLRDPFVPEPAASDLGMQHLVRPVVVVKV